MSGKTLEQWQDAQATCIDWQAAKTWVLSILKQSAEYGGSGLSNAEVRRITALDRKQVNRLIHELGKEGQVRIAGYGRGARYIYTGTFEEGQ